MYDGSMRKKVKVNPFARKSSIISLAVIFISALVLTLFQTKILAKSIDDFDDLITTVEGQCSGTSCYFPISSTYPKRITKIVITNSDTNVSSISNLTYVKKDNMEYFFGKMFLDGFTNKIGSSYTINISCYGAGDLYPREITSMKTTFELIDPLPASPDDTKVTMSLYANSKLNSMGINSCVSK